MSQELDASSASPVASGGGRYEVLRCLAAGAKAETYLCRELGDGGREVVRKFLNPEVSAEIPDIVDAVFPRWAALDHPHVAKVLDFGWEEGRAYLTSEAFSGTPILQALTGAPLEKTWRCFGQFFLALDYLYSHNVPHLDLRPQNVLIGQDAAGEPFLKLVDYGLMPLLYPFNPADSNAIGVPPYTAPEYALRRGPDLRADLYSVGILLFSVLARRLPYEGKDTVALVQAQLQRDAPALSSVMKGAPAPISDFLQRLLNRDPQGRFESPQQALAALQGAVGPGFPAEGLPWPPLFSDPQRIFALKDYLKIFRRIAIAGGRWAIQGPEGVGKSFFSRWLERLFWNNQKNVFRLSGNNLSQIQGEISLNPGFPTYLIIDDADRSATEAWLRARPYGHIIAVGRDMAWATAATGWQRIDLKPLDLAQTTAALEAETPKQDPRLGEAFQARFKGLARDLVMGAPALRRQGLLHRESGTWKFETEKILRAVGGPNLRVLGSPLASLPEAARKRLARLALAPVPWPAASLTEEPELSLWVRDGWVRRMLKGGEEFFQAEFRVASVAESGLSPPQVLSILEEILKRGWSGEAWSAVGRFFPSAAATPESTLLRAKAAAALENYPEVLHLLTSDFVNGLAAEPKAAAFEVFCEALRATGKTPQAEAAFKNAYQSYKTLGQAAGQARVLLEMGVLYRETADTGKALQFFQQALNAAAAAAESAELRGRIELEIGQLYAAATDPESAETHFQEALGALEAARQGDALAQGYAVYAEHCFQSKDQDRAEVFCHEALGWALFQKNAAVQGKVFSIWARILQIREDMRGAFGRLSEAVEALAKAPDETAYARALIARANFALEQRDLDTAQKDSRKSFEIARRLKLPVLEGETLLVVGKVQSRDLEKLDTAVKTLEGARQILLQAKAERRLWECDMQLGEVARYRGDMGRAKGYYQRAMQGLDKVLSQLTPETADAEALTRRRMELQMSMQVAG